MSVYISFKFLHVSTVRKTGSREGVPESSSTRKEAFGVESSSASGDLHSEWMGFGRLSGWSSEFTSWGHQSSKLIRAQSIEVLVKQAQGSNIAAMGQGLELGG